MGSQASGLQKLRNPLWKRAVTAGPQGTVAVGALPLGLVLVALRFLTIDTVET